MNRPKSPTVSRGTCEFCVRPVLETEKAAFPVTGWEIERDAGGANQIFDRERVEGVIAHESCVKVRSRFGGHEQMSLT